MSRSHPGEIKQDKQNSEHHSAQGQHEDNHSKNADLAVEDVRAPNIAQRVREEFEAIQKTLHEKQHSSQQVRKRSISEHTDVADVKAPDMFQRIKEEVEAVAETLHEKNDKASHKPEQHSDGDTTTGCWTNMGKAIEKFCGGNKT